MRPRNNAARLDAKFGSLCVIAVCMMLSQSPWPLVAAEFHVAPDGSPKAVGSSAEPWDLATALSPPEVVQPGDTIWLHEGIYVGGYVSRLVGRADAPITVRGARGERVTIDARPRDERDNALFLLAGGDTIYRDFEVTCTDPRRETRIAGSWPEDIRRGNIDVRGGRIVVANLLVHDFFDVLTAGQEFRIVSAKDFFGAPVLQGTYRGEPVRLSMQPTKASQPVGLPGAVLPETEPGFAAFVVLGNAD